MDARPLVVVGALLGFLPSRAAHADLAPAFEGKVTVDTAYATNVPGPTDIAFTADGRAVITTKGGQVLVRRSNGSLVTIAYPFGGTLDTASEKGLLGVVADPNAASNAFDFDVSNGPTGDKHRVYRSVLGTNNTLTVDRTPIIGASRGVGPGLEGPANHDGGGMVIAKGKLYVGVGDTGFNASPPVNKYGSCLNKGNGKILRVNLDGSVPSDNPLAGTETVSACDSPTGPWTSAAPDRRIYAWGLRNPWRFWLDPQTGLLWIGDVGEVTEEEISVGGGNQHYGWPFVEGNRVWGDVEGKNCTTLTPSRTCTRAAYSYGRSVGQSVTGGLVPSGCGWSRVFSSPHYVFGDFGSSFIRALPLNAGRTGVSSTSPVDFASYGGAPVSFRMGPDGSLYVVLFGANAVYRFTPTDRTGPGCASPGVPASSRKSTLVLSASLALLGIVLATLAVKRRTRPAPKPSG